MLFNRLKRVEKNQVASDVCSFQATFKFFNIRELRTLRGIFGCPAKHEEIQVLGKYSSVSRHKNENRMPYEE